MILGILFVTNLCRQINDLTQFLPILAKFEHLEDLELSDNLLKSLPQDLSSLKSLCTLNISGNPILDLSQLANSLHTLPKLINLHISLSSNDEYDFLFSALPELQTINSKSQTNLSSQQDNLSKNVNNTNSGDQALTEKSQKPSKEPVIIAKNPIDEEELRQFDKIFNLILSVKDKEDKEKYESEYKSRINSISSVLAENLHDQTLIPGIKQSLNIKAKYAVMDLFYEFMLNGQPREHAMIWNLIKKGLDDSLDGLSRIILGMKPEIDNELSIWRDKCKKIQKEMSEILEMSHKLQEDAKNAIQDKENFLTNFNQEKNELISKINILEAENKKYLSTIVRQSKNSQIVQSPKTAACNEFSTISRSDIKATTVFFMDF